ncbi:MAG: hypothetical protein AMXMBFR47_14970 [Planctomycetota bacterium]
MRQDSASRFGRTLRQALSAVAGLGLLCGGAAAQVPVTGAFTYQGQLKASGAVVDGTADFQFSLHTDPSAGSIVGPVIPVSGVTVADGQFTVLLDFGPGAFNGDARWLQIAVRSPAGSGTFQTLNPRQPLTVAPYAQYAVEAGNGGVLTTPPNGTPGVLWTRSPNNTDIFVANALAGIGFSAPVARLHVRAPSGLPAETSRFEDVFGRSQLRIATPESTGRAELQAWNGQTNTAGPLIVNVAGGNVGIGTNAPGSRLDVAGSFESDAFRLNGNGAGAGRVLTSDASGNGTWQVLPPGSQWITNGTNIGYTAGNVGIGTTTPNANFRLQTTGGSSVWRGAIAATGTTNSFVAGELSGIATIGGHNAALTAWADLSINPAGGNVGVGTTTPVSKLDVAGTLTADALSILGTSLTPATIESNNAAGTWLNLRNSSVGGRYWQLISTGSGNGQGAGKLLIGNGVSAGTHDVSAITVEGDGDVGIGTATPAAKLDVIGMARVQALTITGGSDVAEPFNVNSECGALESAATPGMVVTIDPDRVGELRVSGKAYDRTVAGIISGANGVNPGMVLTQTGSVADGKHPVALTGRAWAWCDADAGGAIVAGDMLTTSDTPGHAMRVGDHEKANGAVIGKAMSSLKSGKGMVLVLVNLQ